jgi:hydroxymethylpyrimidine/phosphomethylpyrimidine kinase
LLVLIPAGAGVLTDIKTFEQHRVYGFAITTANTIQTEFLSIQWTEIALYCVLSKNYSNYIHKSSENWYCSSLAYLQEIVLTKGFQKTSIVWDTVLKSSTEYDFLNIENQTVLSKILKNVDLITQLSRNHKLSPAKLMLKISQAISVYFTKRRTSSRKNIDTLYTKEIIPF